MAASKTVVLVTCLLSLFSNSILAIPADQAVNQLAAVEKRNERSNPKPLVLDISEWAGIAELNCWSMLCRYHGERVWQRAVSASANDRHRTASGADMVPFHTDQLASRHTERINDNTVSAEEFPWASMEEGGNEAAVMPATEDEQGGQGRALSSAYQTQNVNRGDWFKITFNPPNRRGRYCRALHEEPPNTRICDEDPAQTIFGSTAVKLAKFAFVLERVGKPFGFRRLNPGKGTRSVEVEVEVELPFEA
ncbi:hypothetical protein CC86DRAFT_384344 [Ophiobolus disseminans]|uniref:Deoxyribonuclease NucA/NucB domain-containing protein n=1 Tax=Ophiobolus disseminans TaxID=1469910 RepID=A0A6A6ZTZ6_9PLEO|nr:hypothetical protein CC86DRAFT_384344 [Ophiobolus disseminans]